VEKTTTTFYGSTRVKEVALKNKKETELNKRTDVKAAAARNKPEKKCGKR
jgi:hypothetical protein